MIRGKPRTSSVIQVTISRPQQEERLRRNQGRISGTYFMVQEIAGSRCYSADRLRKWAWQERLIKQQYEKNHSTRMTYLQHAPQTRSLFLCSSLCRERIDRCWSSSREKTACRDGGNWCWRTKLVLDAECSPCSAGVLGPQVNKEDLYRIPYHSKPMTQRYKDNPHCP